MDVRAAVTAEKALQRGLRLARVDLIAESAGCTKRKPEELQLVRGLTRAVGKQLHAARTHFGIALVGQQLNAVIQRAHGADQLMAQPLAKKACNINGLQIESL